MKILSILLLSAAIAGAQTIETRQLTPAAPMKIAISPNVTTTLLFPSEPASANGLGLVMGKDQSGSVMLEHPSGSNLYTLCALNDKAQCVMTILLSGTLYVFEIATSPTPDVAITLTKDVVTNDPKKEISAEYVRSQRLNYSPEQLVGFLNRVHDAKLLRANYPDLYKGYDTRPASYTSDSGLVLTTVQNIHRFSLEDATVLQGTVKNETTEPIQFDGRSATVLIANEIHPVKLFDCARPIPGGAVVPFEAVIQGDIDGGRAHISIDNEFRLVLPPIDGHRTVWDYKNGGKGSGQFKVPKPAAPSDNSVIPLTQTSSPVLEVK